MILEPTQRYGCYCYVDDEIARLSSDQKIANTGSIILVMFYVITMLPNLRSFYQATGNIPGFPLNAMFALLEWESRPAGPLIVASGALGIATVLLYLARTSQPIAYGIDRLMNHLFIFGPLRLLRQRLAVLTEIEAKFRNHEQGQALQAARSAKLGYVFNKELDDASEALRNGLAHSWTDALAYAPTVFETATAQMLRDAQMDGRLHDVIGLILNITKQKLRRYLKNYVQVIMCLWFGIVLASFCVPLSIMISTLY